MEHKFLSTLDQFKMINAVSVDMSKTHFFFSVIMSTKHEVFIREAYNLLDYLSDIGGIFGILVSVGGLIQGYFASI